MPNYEFQGRVCKQIHQIFLPLAQFTEHLKCPCKQKRCIMADLVILPRGWDNYNQQLPGVVYFENANGDLQVAGNSLDPTPKGFVRKEAMTLNDLRKIEHRLNDDQLRIRQRFIEREQEHSEKVISENRRELRGLMEQFSTQGRTFAKDMMRRNDTRKTIYDKKVDPGVNFHILHYDQKR